MLDPAVILLTLALGALCDETTTVRNKSVNTITKLAPPEPVPDLEPQTPETQSPNPVAISYDTIIVGMGAAGCAAASELCKAGKNVLGLEAQDRIGGRVHTVEFGTGVVELGAEWIHGERPSIVYDLAKEHNVTIKPQDISFRVFRSDGSEADTVVINDLVNYTLACVDDPPDNPQPLGQYLTTRVLEYMDDKYPELRQDGDFVHQFLSFMDLVIDNYEASDSWNDVTTHSKYENLDGNLHLSWNTNGYKTLFDILLNKYNNGEGYPNLSIELNKVVKTIKYVSDPVEDVEVECEDGSVYKGKNVIVTVSLGVLKERYAYMFRPPLPDKKASAIDALSIGVIDKIVLLFPNKWWPEDLTLFGFLWNEKDQYCMPKEEEWLTKIFGASAPMGTELTLTLWTSGRVAKLVETLPDDLVKRKVMRLLRKFMGKHRTIPEPTEMLRTNWFSNPYTRGSYTYDNLMTPMYPNARSILAEPIQDSSGNPRIMFAGEATDVTHFSTVHGAVDSGRREAKSLH